MESNFVVIGRLIIDFLIIAVVTYYGIKELKKNIALKDLKHREMKNMMSYIGVVQNVISDKENRDSWSSEIIFTIPKEDFLQIDRMEHISCDVEDIAQFEIPAYIHSINKTNGKHQMYVVSLHLKPSYADIIKKGMIVNVKIELSDKKNTWVKNRA